MSEQQQQENTAVAAAASATVDRLARIETKLDGIRDDREDFRADLASHETRLDRVERFMWLALGMAFASGVPDAVRAFAGATA